MKNLPYSIVSLSFILGFTTSLYAAEPNWSNYNAVLSVHTKNGYKDSIQSTLLNYQAIKNDNRFRLAIAEIESFDTNQLRTKEEYLSFYINAYNLYAIKMVVDHYPLKSIKDIGNLFNSVWKKDIGKIDGKDISLDDIEHKILRKMHEPRIHFAIVCASMSCPDLKQSAYTAKTLYKDLNQQTKGFLNNTDKGVKFSNGKMKISKIFDWFEKDFDIEGGVRPFINAYTPLSSKYQIQSYLPYNWKLNEYVNKR